jgi:hypothetical protein
MGLAVFRCSIPSDHFFRLYAHFTSGLLRGVYLPNFSFIFLYKWIFLYLYVINYIFIKMYTSHEINMTSINIFACIISNTDQL